MIVRFIDNFIGTCNTYDRYSRYCLRTYLTDKGYNAYVIADWEYNYYAQVGHDGADLEGCIDQTFAFEYYAATWSSGDHDDADDDQDDDNPITPDDFDDDKHDDFAAMLLAGAVAMLL